MILRKDDHALSCKSNAGMFQCENLMWAAGLCTLAVGFINTLDLAQAAKSIVSAALGVSLSVYNIGCGILVALFACKLVISGIKLLSGTAQDAQRIKVELIVSVAAALLVIASPLVVDFLFLSSDAPFSKMAEGSTAFTQEFDSGLTKTN